MRARVCVFIPCVVETFLPEIGLKTIRVLEKFSCSVSYKKKQLCCGQIFYNAGYLKEALPFARHFIKLFKDEDFVVIPSGSCTSMIKIHYSNLNLREKERKEYEKLKGRVFELSEFIYDILCIREVNSFFNCNAMYHRSCHLLRELGVETQPLKLLSFVKGLKIIDETQGFECCGFGGIFSLKFSSIAEAILERKIDGLKEKGIDTVISANAGCILNMKSHLEKKGIKALHIAEILYGEE